MVEAGAGAARRYKVIAVAALLWSLAGVAAFVAQETMSAAAVAALPPVQRQLWQNQPAWDVAAYAAAVFGQLAGALALLLRHRWAVPLFAIAIVAILVQFSYPFLLSGALAAEGPSILIFPALILLVAVLLLIHARVAARRGFLR